MAEKLSTLLNALAGKTAPVSADKLPLLDSATSGLFDTVTIGDLRKTTVTAVTTTASPATSASGNCYTNEGDADGATITLPSAAAGVWFSIVVQAAQTLTVTAATGDTIRAGTNVTTAGGSITSNAPGSALILLAINATEWVALSLVGTWSF